MPSPLKLFSNQLNPKRQIPTGPLAIDKTHPLANALIGCWVPGVMGAVDLTGNTAFALGSAASFQVTSEGPGLHSAGTSSTWGLSGLAPAIYKNWTQLSVYWRGYIAAYPTGGRYLIGMVYDQIGTNPREVAMIQIGAAGSLSIRWDGGGGENQDNFTGTYTAPGVVSVGATWKAPSGTVQAYLNGNKDVGDGFGGAYGTTSTTTLAIAGCHSTQNPSLVGTCSIACFWNRALLASEMALIDKDPYCFLMPAVPKTGLMTAVAAALAHFRKTFSPIGTRVGTRQTIGSDA